MSSVKKIPDIVITKHEAKIGMTIKVEKGQRVLVDNWVNKRGTNILFIAPITGMYKIEGNIEDASTAE